MSRAMRRRRSSRRTRFGPFGTNPTSALMRMGSLLIVVGLIYSWARQPQSWRWLETASDAAAPVESPESGSAVAQVSAAGNRQDATAAADIPAAETVVPGATDLDKAEWEKSARLFEALSDKTALGPEEMSAYWRCMKWARAQTFAELDRRAARDVAYTRLFEEPEKYRGRLLRLRLHILQILEWDAHENSAGVKHVYDARGFTDQSNALYITVFSELPEGMKLGEGLHEEGEFVGYFLKDLGYQAFNRNRSAPLLIGRMHRVAGAAPAPFVARSDWNWLWAIAVVFVLIGFSTAWLRFRRTRRAPVAVSSPTDDAEIEEWFKREGEGDPARPGGL
jgi:hypothetical protein